MRIALVIEGDELIVRLWQDGLDDPDGEDASVLISQASISLHKLRREIDAADVRLTVRHNETLNRAKSAE